MKEDLQINKIINSRLGTRDIDYQQDIWNSIEKKISNKSKIPSIYYIGLISMFITLTTTVLLYSFFKTRNHDTKFSKSTWLVNKSMSLPVPAMSNKYLEKNSYKKSALNNSSNITNNTLQYVSLSNKTANFLTTNTTENFNKYRNNIKTITALDSINSVNLTSRLIEPRQFSDSLLKNERTLGFYTNELYVNSFQNKIIFNIRKEKNISFDLSIGYLNSFLIKKPHIDYYEKSHRTIVQSTIFQGFNFILKRLDFELSISNSRKNNPISVILGAKKISINQFLFDKEIIITSPNNQFLIIEKYSTGQFFRTANNAVLLLEKSVNSKRSYNLNVSLGPTYTYGFIYQNILAKDIAIYDSYKPYNRDYYLFAYKNKNIRRYNMLFRIGLTVIAIPKIKAQVNISNFLINPVLYNNKILNNIHSTDVGFNIQFCLYKKDRLHSRFSCVPDSKK